LGSRGASIRMVQLPSKIAFGRPMPRFFAGVGGVELSRILERRCERGHVVSAKNVFGRARIPTHANGPKTKR